MPFPSASSGQSTRKRRRAPWILAIAASAVLALGLGAFAGQQSYANQVLVAVPLAGEQVNGSAMLTVRRSGATELKLSQLNDPPSGKGYVLWVIPPDSKPIAAGTVTRCNETIAISHPVLGTTVAITTEDDPRAQAPTSKPFLTTKVVA